MSFKYFFAISLCVSSAVAAEAPIELFHRSGLVQPSEAAGEPEKVGFPLNCGGGGGCEQRVLVTQRVRSSTPTVVVKAGMVSYPNRGPVQFEALDSSELAQVLAPLDTYFTSVSIARESAQDAARRKYRSLNFGAPAAVPIEAALVGGACGFVGCDMTFVVSQAFDGQPPAARRLMRIHVSSVPGSISERVQFTGVKAEELIAILERAGVPYVQQVDARTWAVESGNCTKDPARPANDRFRCGFQLASSRKVLDTQGSRALMNLLDSKGFEGRRGMDTISWPVVAIACRREYNAAMERIVGTCELTKIADPF